jgi:membrane-bound lytic murein transglycosylase D
VVNGNHKEIPLTLNRHVQNEIDLFTKGREKKFFLESYKRSGKYRPMITEALKSAGLPEELSWLPLIESGYKVNALSSARALGLWQFIPSTGYKFGLKRDRYIDERLDFEKSTHAAIAYMKELHQIFGEWSTVLAAYNCGEGRVLRVIRTQNVNYLDNFWDLYKRLPRETARYVPRFLATLHIVNNLEKYGLAKVKVDPPLEWETVELTKKAHIKDIAKAIGLDRKDIKALNPELRLDILPSEEYPLRVPFEKKEILVASLDEIQAYSPPPAPQSKYRYHRVRRGETLSTIARRYGVGMKSIARANQLNRKYTIVAGQTLKIPARYYSGSSTGGGTAKATASGKPVTHVVKAGDSLWVLARKYGTTTKKIQDINGLSNSNLYIGQVLKITPHTGTGAAGRDKYRVRRGDSPFSIAKRHNMSLKRFLKINRLNSRSKIYPGQVYYVE